MTSHTVRLIGGTLACLATLVPTAAAGQEDGEAPAVDAGESHQVFVSRVIAFTAGRGQMLESETIQDMLWDFGDGVQKTGEQVTHAYTKAGTYTVTLTVTTDSQTLKDTTEVVVFDHQVILVADSSAPEDHIDVARQKAASEGVLLRVLRARGSGPEVLTEEELTKQLVEVREDIAATNIMVLWTSGGVGANVLSKFAQNLRQAVDPDASPLLIEHKGIIIVTDTSFPLLTPAAQSAFDQLRPSYILLTKPQALDLVLTPQTAEEARDAIVLSPIEHRLLGHFSARTVRDIGIANFLSFGVNYLVNQGVPINNIILVLMLPVIATILSFSRQVIGIKAFGIITPAMTALSFLVLGLQYGLIVFLAVLASGTLTRLLMRKLRLLYLPRMALVLTTVSLAILLLLGFSAATDGASGLSFSIFPILILTLLAEEFIAVQFSSGIRSALTITTWTLLLAILGYFIVSWEPLRTAILSYPEFVLLAIPINILLGRWSGLRLTEYFRFRELARFH